MLSLVIAHVQHYYLPSNKSPLVNDNRRLNIKPELYRLFQVLPKLVFWRPVKQDPYGELDRATSGKKVIRKIKNYL